MTRPPSLRENQAFIEHVGQGWEPQEVLPTLPEGTAQAAADHRRRLSEALPGRQIVLMSGTAPVRNDDNDYLFRADSSFVWATGCQAEGAVLVMTPTGAGHDATLYVPPPFRPGEVGFFGDASYGELWVGPVPGLAEWQQALDIWVRPRAELTATLEADAEVARVASTLRGVKDAWEIGQLREAVDLTVGGFEAVAREIPRAVREGLGERWLQGTFDRHARTNGNGVGYSTIVGSGPHAPVLDMGVEAHSLYTADVTRTIPASGTFTPTERAVHDLVEKAHRAGLAQIRPGVQYLDFHHAAMEVIAQGLSDWDLLPVSVDEALSPEGQQHRRWLVCGIGHHLGLDVHDCSKAEYADYQGADLEPGVVMTVEPGLYFHRNDLLVPPEMRGIGVRLEDDVLVTGTGSEVLSEALPIDAEGVEAWTREFL
jgi:Xaa-Pro aminopeptidase